MYNYDSPVNYVDRDGRLGILATAAIGGAIGAVGGGLYSYVPQVITNVQAEGFQFQDLINVNTQEITKSAVVGGTIGVGVGSGAAILPAAIELAGGIGAYTTATLTSWGIGAGTATAVGTGTAYVAGTGTAALFGAGYGAATCAINPMFSEASRTRCAEIAYLGMSGAQSSYSFLAPWSDFGKLTSTTNSCQVPNPYGKKGGPLHQGKIQQVVTQLEQQGYKVIRYEKPVYTTGGFKDLRYGDVLVESPTGEQIIIQVGKQTAGGLPVSRESDAIKDFKSAGYKVEFYPYNK